MSKTIMNRMRGLNIGGWLSQVDAIQAKDPGTFPGVDIHVETFIGEPDFANVKSWGFDHVRVPVDSYLFFDDDEKPIESRIAHLDNAVKLAKQNGLKFILDLHECPGHDFANAAAGSAQKIFTDDKYIKKTEKIWAFIAERYGAYEHVLFEALNEPVAPSAEVWNKVKDRLCREIRRHAPKSTIITGSNMWYWPSMFSKLIPVDDDNIVYCFHSYEPFVFTHQNAPWSKSPEIKVARTYPSDYGADLTLKCGLWDRSRLVAEFEPVNAFRKKYNVPVICGEFGVYAQAELKAQLRWLNDVLAVLKEMEIGFSYWNYKNLDFGIISIGEKLHENLPQYNNPERINYPILDVLRQY